MPGPVFRNASDRAGRLRPRKDDLLRLSAGSGDREKLAVMRAVSVLIVVAAFAAGAASLIGTAAASHRAAIAASRNATSPSWSPGGKQIVFAYVGRGYRIVRTSSRPGGAVRTVYTPRSHGDSYDPLGWVAGSRIVFGNYGTLHVVGVRGGKAKRLLLPTYPQEFILTHNREYAAVRIDGGGDPHQPESIALLRLKPGRAPVVMSTPLTAEENSQITDAILAFSPNGRQLVFSRARWDVDLGQTGPAVLMAIRLSGGNSVPLAQSGITGASLVPSDVQQLQWSPDGRWVAFVENQSLEVVPTAGGSAPRVLASCFDPGAPYTFFGGFSWSPTSMSIAYDCVDGEYGGGQIFTVRRDGTRRTDLLKGRIWGFVGGYEGERVPQWSPDGSRLLVLASQAYGATTSVFTIRPNGHDLTRLG
jgi:Tol biopolymer transport system component